MSTAMRLVYAALDTLITERQKLIRQLADAP
jgi:hypothetical protein